MAGVSDTTRWILGGGRQPVNAMELAVERLGSAVRLGVFPVGTQLPPERELASLMGVSRATVREAIRLLAEQGTLAAYRGRTGGTFVVEAPDRPELAEVQAAFAARQTNLVEVLDQRWAVETAVAELAAQRATPEQIATMRELLTAMEAAHDDTDTYRRLDTELHLLLGQAAHSRRLVELLVQSHRELADLMALVPHSPDIRRHSSGQHRSLVRAIDRRRPRDARDAMDEHVAGTASFLMGLVGTGSAASRLARRP